jgi:hypothetical protein
MDNPEKLATGNKKTIFYNVISELFNQNINLK